MVFYYAKPTWKSRSNPRRPIGAAANKLSAYANPADIPGTSQYIYYSFQKFHELKMDTDVLQK
jgi:hypothetical protein